LLLPLLLLGPLGGCKSSSPLPPDDDPAIATVMPSRQLTEDQALTLEFEVMTSPANIPYRVDLLWHYRGRFADPQAERLANRHVLWLTANRPRAAVLATPVAEIPTVPDRTAYEEAKALWTRHVEANPKDAAILGHAGIFFRREEPGRATELLERAAALAPDELTWLVHLAEAYRDAALSAGGDRRELSARLSLQMFERSVARAPSERQRMNLLLRAATLAGKTEDQRDEAVVLAGQAQGLLDKLEAGPDRAAFEHNIHVITGLHRLRHQKLEEAKESLALAEASIRGQSLSLSDLDLSLAAGLLEAGEKDVVLRYLAACETATRSAEATNWSRSIRAGEQPKFDAYLH
jgi:hypothetical protein